MTIEIPGGIWSLEESVEESAKKEAEKAYKATVKSSSGKLASKIVKFGRIILPSPVEVALDGTVSSEQFIDKEARNCSLYSDRFPSIFDKSPFMLDESGSVYFFSRRCWGCQGIAKQIKGYLDRTDGTSVK
ncbi:MAG: hypothetical protein KKD18_06180, partial [Nanoarchaeota archaeon]|nr:hypothetical protein [Nanoarchaeota archaeon]